MCKETAEASAEAVKKKHENNRCFMRKDAAVNSFSSRSHTERQHDCCVFTRKHPRSSFIIKELHTARQVSGVFMLISYYCC